MQPNPFAIPIILALVSLLYLFRVTWAQRSQPSARILLGVLGCMVFTLGSYILELVSTDLRTMDLIVRMEFTGEVPLSTFFLLFILVYTGREAWLTRRNIALLCIVPLSFLIVAWIIPGGFESIIMYGKTVKVGDYYFFDSVFSNLPLVWVAIIYFQIIELFAILLMLERATRTTAMFRGQVLFLLMATLAPALGNLVDVLGLNPLPFLDPLVFALAFGCIPLGLSQIHYRLLELMPAAHDLIIKNLSTPIFVTDQNLRVVEVNKAAGELLGSQTELTLGIPAPVMLPFAAEVIRSYQGNVITATVTVPAPTGQRYYDLRLSALYDTLNLCRGHMIVFNDITARINAEQQSLELALERQQIRILKDFVGDMYHDLMTPLTKIKTASYLIDRLSIRMSEALDPLTGSGTDISLDRDKIQHVVNDAIQDHVTIRNKVVSIDESSTRLIMMIKRMLEMTQLDNHVLDPVDLVPTDFNRFVGEIVTSYQDLAQSKQIQLLFVPDPQPIFVALDPTEFPRVVQNLVSNALNYTPSAGSVMVGIQAEAQQVVLEVSDTGIGIPGEDLPHIFERFYRVDKSRSVASGGIGLGLSIVQKIVNTHQGIIQVESNVGKGTTFRIRLARVYFTGLGNRLSLQQQAVPKTPEKDNHNANNAL